MKCPKCSQGLWFSRTYCPFCKTAIPESQQTGIPLSARLNWIVLIAWCGWFARELGMLAASKIWDIQFSVDHDTSVKIGVSFGNPLLVGLGGWFALRLYDQPKRSRAIPFILVCLVLLWKYSLANIVFPMLPQFGGLTLTQAMDRWWSFSTSSLGRMIASILIPGFLVFSIGYWPVYCRWVIRRAASERRLLT
jgi:hypothetical protein